MKIKILGKMVLILTAIILLMMNRISHAEVLFLQDKTEYEVCFTPGQDCTQLIVKYLSKAEKSIYVQAYSFTSSPIAKALVNAKLRGVNVFVILDKSQIKNNKYSSSKYLTNQDVPVWIDYKPVIAHNKVIIIGDAIVITGSFNFTKAAQERNAENLLIINNHDIANKYLKNWIDRKKLSLSSQVYS